MKTKTFYKKWRCLVCGETHSIYREWSPNHPTICPVWSVNVNGYRETLNALDDETEQEWAIDNAWEAKVRSIVAWESGFTEHKIRCWYCGEWFLSDSNLPAGCYKCATIKEETP